ncbi:hypothetical protein IWGMT90018_05760 [Mycobacterium kiyosense]|nr:hypothetical protein IWGMT90018_05760 [Mycobacterium kiyosense]
MLWVGHRQNWGWLHDFDWMLLTPAHDIGVKHHGWVRFWYLVSIVLGPVPLRVLGLVAAAAALVRRQLRLALLVLLGAVLSGLVTWVAKGLAGRPRPATALVAAAETSFPSGHALEATAGVLALLTFLLPLLTARWLRTSAMTAGGAERVHRRGRPGGVECAPSLGRGRRLGAGLRLLHALSVGVAPHAITAA